MATYNEKYYAQITRADGTTIRLSVQRRDYAGPVFRMAGIQAIELEIGGGGAPVYTPVVKTMARFTVVDAHDIGSPQGGEDAVTIEGGGYVKHGRWEEFYTNDPTLYRVQIGGSAGVVWSGYVTPDSWEESISYRGSITVVARDMLGTLQDVGFSHTSSRITIANLVSRAFSVCGCPMSCGIDIINQLYNKSDGSSIVNARVNVSAFEDESWWDALTSVLDSLGMVVRYTGRNAFILTSLKNLPVAVANSRHGCEFVNRSGVRTLDPPVRDISSLFELKYSDGALVPIGNASLEPNGGIATYVYTERQTATGKVQGRSIISVPKAEVPSSNESEWQARPTLRPTLLHKITLPAHSSLIASGFTGFSPMYFIANSGGDYGDTYFESVCDVSMKAGVVHSPVRLVIRQDGALLTTDGSYMYLARGLDEESVPQLSMVEMYIRATGTNNTVYHYNGSGWVTGDEKANELYSDGLEPLALTFNNGEASIEIFPPQNVTLRPETFVVCITHISVAGFLDYNKPHNGIVVPLAFTIAEPSSSGLATKYGVTTKYSDDYNVRISRAPKFGCINTVLPGRLFTNAIVDADGNALADSWNFSGQSTGYPLEVMVQAQMLMHFVTALSIFGGTLHDKNDRTAIPGYGFTYATRPCLLLRGVYDFASGFIRSVAIREFKTWEEVWPSFNPTYTIKTSRPAGGGSSGGSSGGGGGGAGGGTVTSVDMTVPAGFTIGGNPITGAGVLELGFSAGYSLPASADVAKGVTAYGWGDHASQGYLKSINSTMVINALGYTPQEQIQDLDLLWARANHGQTAYGWGNHANAGYAYQADLDALAEIVEELGDPHCWVAPRLDIIRGHSHYTFDTIEPFFRVRHPLIGKAGARVVLMMWRPRRSRSVQNHPHTERHYSGWGEARGASATGLPMAIIGVAGVASIPLNNVRLWLLQRYICNFEMRQSDFLHGLTVAAFRNYSTSDYNFAFGGTWPQDMQAATRPGFAKWKDMTERWRQFGFAIRLENPEWTDLGLTNVAETTREIDDPNHQGSKIVRYLYSDIVPFRAFVNTGTKDIMYATDKWDIGFNLGGDK